MNNDRTFNPNIPPHTWKRPIGLGWDNPYTVRYASNLDDGPWHGMPLGGFGAGCIGRSPRGDFNLWHIDGGEHIFRSLPACQFSVFEETKGKKQAYALSTEQPTDGSLSSWQWYPGEASSAADYVTDVTDVTDEKNKEQFQSSGTYHALYPRSWYVYENVFEAQLSCEQFSPIIPNNYQESSYPVAMFEWVAHNPTDAPITLSIMLTWENIVGWFTNANKSPEVKVRDDGSPFYDYKSRWGESGGNMNLLVEDFHRFGCVMTRLTADDRPQEGDGQWAIATITNPAVEVFYQTRWNPAGNGEDIWRHFSSQGFLLDDRDETAAAPGEQLACAIAVRFTIRPGKTRKIPFIIAWDLPVTEFASGVSYYRRYTDFFGRNGKNVWPIIRTAMKHSDTWRENIEAWQKPILERTDLSDSFKMALFNELYILTQGGSLWSAADERDPKGQFGVLECIDYRWYESLDVRLYGSFALLMLWPELEKSVIIAFARAISAGDDTPRVIGWNQAAAIRKSVGATPHDLGAPNEHPWEKTNYTSYQDCNLWKDLPCDFVLQVYRDFLLTGGTDCEFLQECWPAIVEALAYLKTFDEDGDGIPENSGAPDQTFDDWQMRGISAYCGGLWLAALESAIAIGSILEDAAPEILPNPQGKIALYHSWLLQARPSYQEKLWNGQYYRLDSESNSEVVMADQLCGQFYAKLLGLPDIVPPECAVSALETVYESCFLKFNDGEFGAANGVMLNGSPENPNATHPLEVWTGINFGLAAFLVQMGMEEKAFKLTDAVVRQIYENGLQFRTPEAITAGGTFRASHYLRAMAIWAIYGVLTNFK
ncbi:MAG: bile acid beta-glucosidase [Microcoleus sp. PH2017_10_PVI_O_A]|uniref:GH116 family glycosyl hydrolase n=1 Tax=unclassified Microcoleus TaxID=2642155 RepID=UPI001DA5DDFF|nr:MULTISPECIES: GH116 family glycosyl hydrolase [unclassified Microcoleus]TAE84871.1 MAG: bile acid beta-glucosidase [Oscillatoriales cyanobacterium]MCC3404137.1 bile acid beta-glucosidase [Microcoleus sp. PH2017_10_PVI_O_A]MCC3458222.1 bile acid beta-glucosidase [Microcoleus sp. PH2017_11_PCY_U_A]MCC3476692.1 bile acid beta-glucosidase [Microcoleus sp. PH2017_12_PCY_D_A]MCC3529541.1 bile acid beta-glucosidase [Microcoleus sp. PH2017_21_RUC_O_A]